MRPALLAGWLCTAAALAHGAPHESSIDVSFPDDVAGFSFDRRTEFPQKELGVNLAYSRPGPVVGSVYIYSAGRKSIPAGTESPAVRKHFAQVIGEVRMMQTLGKARAVTLLEGEEQTTSYGGCGPEFIWRGYEIELAEGTTMVSFTYLTAMKDHFVKLRMSYRKGDPQGDLDVERFVRQIRKVLGHCQQ